MTAPGLTRRAGPRVGLALAGFWLATSASPAPAAAQAAATPATRGEWTTAGLDAAGTRHSPLDQIRRDNVRQLAVAWQLPTGATGPHEGAPLVVDGVMYLHTPHPNRVLAVDLANPTRPRWTYTPPAGPLPPATGFRDAGTRGLAWHPDGLVFVPITAGYLAALDARTGREIWRLRNADARQGGSVQSAPVVIGDVVVIGMAGAEYGVRGHLSAYRAQNGKLLWRAYSTGPDGEISLRGPANSQYATHTARDLGVLTWPGRTWERGGGTTDGWITWDAALGLLYHGTGPPSPWHALLRPGENKWTSSIIAREVATGRVRWAFQLTPGDPWAYGAETENILADLRIGGRTVPALVHAGRNGFIYTFDRTNGRLLVVERGGPANWATLITPGTPVPVRDQRLAPSASGVVRGVCPSTFGLKGSAPAAFSPGAGLLIAPLVNLCMEVRPAAPTIAPGSLALGAEWRLVEAPGAAQGRVIAWDPAVGAIRWEAREPQPLLGGVLVTAGGLVLHATGDGLLKALDLDSGRELWRAALPQASVGTPMTFLGPDGRQYLAIYSGPGGWPSVPGLGQHPGGEWAGHTEGSVTVFALPATPEAP